jgi:hypothetical protein
MSDRDHYQHNSYHRSSNNTNRDSPSSRRSSSSNAPAASYNGGGHSGGGGKNMPAATMRNSSPAVSPSTVAGLTEDLGHLNLPNEVTVGSTVQCTMLRSNRIYKGEVLAFDPNVKAIILSKFLKYCSVLIKQNILL